MRRLPSEVSENYPYGNSVAKTNFQQALETFKYIREQQRIGMPKVVANQQQKFDSGDLFTKLKSNSTIAYVGFGSTIASEQRRSKFQTDLARRRIEIAFKAVGLNLHICVGEQSDQEGDSIRLNSEFILDGVCVKFIGELNCQTLEGIGRVEYDQQRADEENRRLYAELHQYKQFLEGDQQRATTIQNCSSSPISSSANAGLLAIVERQTECHLHPLAQMSRLANDKRVAEPTLAHNSPRFIGIAERLINTELMLASRRAFDVQRSAATFAHTHLSLANAQAAFCHAHVNLT